MAEATPAQAPAAAPSQALESAISVHFRSIADAANALADLFAGATAPGKKKGKRGEGKSKEDKPKRPPTEFNKYMSTQVGVVKQLHPEMTHREAFKVAANQWKDVKAANTAMTGAVAETAAHKDAEIMSKAAADDDVPAAEGEKKKKKKKKKHHHDEAAEAAEAEDGAEAEEPKKKHKKKHKKDKEREPEISE